MSDLSLSQKTVDSRFIRKVELAREILHLAHRSGWRSGHHLIEAELCEAMGVSRSPIRAALGVLEEWGSVERRPNHGCYLRGDAEQLLGTGKEIPTSATDDLLLRIVRARVAGRLGDSITQVELMELFSESRSAVDSVLRRMAVEGLIERRKGRGWRFLPTFDGSPSWVQGYQFRLAIEPAAIRMPDFEVDHKALAQCRLDHLDLVRHASSQKAAPGWAFRVDADFHELIASFSKNAFFLQAIQNQNRLRRLFEYDGYPMRRCIPEWCGEHLEIIEALERGRYGEAAEQMRRHLELAAVVAASLNHAEAPDETPGA